MKDIQGEMEKWAVANGVEVKKTEVLKKKKSTEKLSERDLKKLMGVDQPTYRRVSGGAMRQR